MGVSRRSCHCKVCVLVCTSKQRIIGGSGGMGEGMEVLPMMAYGWRIRHIKFYNFVKKDKKTSG